jgi:hypothetical protein
MTEQAKKNENKNQLNKPATQVKPAGAGVLPLPTVIEEEADDDLERAISNRSVH